MVGERIQVLYPNLMSLKGLASLREIITLETTIWSHDKPEVWLSNHLAVMHIL